MDKQQLYEFLAENREVILADIKPKVQKLLEKKKYFSGVWLQEFTHSWEDNVKHILKEYLAKNIPQDSYKLLEIFEELEDYLKENFYSEKNYD